MMHNNIITLALYILLICRALAKVIRQKIVPTHACSILFLALPGTEHIQENLLLHFNTQYTKSNCYTGMCIAYIGNFILDL